MATVFSSQEITIEINTTPAGGSETWVELIETTGISQSNDINIDERDTYGDSATKRTATGGKKWDMSFETKLTPGDVAHEYLRDMFTGTDIRAHNGQQIKLTMPIADTANQNARTETYTGVIKPTATGGQGALDLAVINFDFMSDSAPVIVKEAS